jgi:DNA invertase Pin-like site-specific DNA recombinase
MAATAQAQAEATKEAQQAGIEHAKAEGSYLGRKPSYTREQLDTVRDMLDQSADIAARFPQELSARITVRTKDGRELVVEHIGYEGGLDKLMSWDRVVEKFHWLSEA